MEEYDQFLERMGDSLFETFFGELISPFVRIKVRFEFVQKRFLERFSQEDFDQLWKETGEAYQVEKDVTEDELEDEPLFYCRVGLLMLERIEQLHKNEKAG